MDLDSSSWTGEPITLAPVLPGSDDASRETLVAVYADAFSAPPYHRSKAQVAHFRNELRSQVNRAGFTAFRAEVGERTLGFGYGFTTNPHHQWHQYIQKALGTRADLWLTDCFVLAELAVHPDAQGLGIGRAIHDALLAAQRHPRAVLSTLDAPTQARVMYATAGWRVLANNVRFPRSTERFVIMGRRLDESE